MLCISTEVDRNTTCRQVSSGTHMIHQQRHMPSGSNNKNNTFKRAWFWYPVPSSQVSIKAQFIKSGRKFECGLDYCEINVFEVCEVILTNVSWEVCPIFWSVAWGESSCQRQKHLFTSNFLTENVFTTKTIAPPPLQVKWIFPN